MEYCVEYTTEKCIRSSVKDGRVIVKAPKKTAKERIEALLQQHKLWIKRRLTDEAQKKQLEKRRKEEERKIRTHRLIEIGAAVESVLGRCIELEEIPKLIAFLNKQEANGKFFSKAMQKGPDTDMKKEEVGASGVS